MKHNLFLVLNVFFIFTLFPSCSNHKNLNSSVEIVIVEDGTNLKDIEIQRHTRKSFLRRIFNPVGSTYHPYSIKESLFTDENGKAIFNVTKNDDIFVIKNINSHDLKIIIQGNIYPITRSPSYNKHQSDFILNIVKDDIVIRKSSP